MDKKFLVEQIKTFVSISDIFDKYVGTAPDMHGRYKCPFNDKEDRKNFGIKHNQLWHCFSCGSTGDQITLVQKLFDLPFNDAILKIAEDFHLSTEKDEKMSLKMRIEMQRRILQKEKDKRYQQYFDYKARELYNHIVGLTRILEDIIRKTNPTEETKKYYAYSYKSEINLDARARNYKLQKYLDILTEMPQEEDYVTYADRDILHERATTLVNKYIKGELEL